MGGRCVGRRHLLLAECTVDGAHVAQVRHGCSTAHGSSFLVHQFLIDHIPMEVCLAFGLTVNWGFIRSAFLLLDVADGLLALGVVGPRVVIQLLDLVVLGVGLGLGLILLPLGRETVHGPALLVDQFLESEAAGFLHVALVS